MAYDVFPVATGKLRNLNECVIFTFLSTYLKSISVLPSVQEGLEGFTSARLEPKLMSSFAGISGIFQLRATKFQVANQRCLLSLVNDFD